MNRILRPLPQLEHGDDAVDRPFPCRCGFTAPGEIIEYYRLYHVLGCMRCRAALARVLHPVPAVPRPGNRAWDWMPVARAA